MDRLSLGVILTGIVGITALSKAFAAEKYTKLPIIETSDATLLAEDSAAENNSGSFIGVGHPTLGQAKIVTKNQIKYLDISENFSTDGGPDLKVILHNSSIVNAQIEEGEYISLGALKAVEGSQRYLIPDDVNVEQYQSVAIWSEEFNVTFGYAPFSQEL